MSGPGTTLKDIFESTLLKVKGTDVLIYEGWQSKDMSSIEARAIKDRGKQYFEFPVDTKIDKDNVVQIKGSRDFWRVLDTEEDYQYGVAVKMHVRVVKIDYTGNEIHLNPEGRAVYYTTHIGGDNYGGIQQGGQGNRQNVSITNNQSLSEILPKLAQLIKELKKAEFQDREDAISDLEKVQELAVGETNEGVWKRIQAKLTAAKTTMEIAGLAYNSLPYWEPVWNFFQQNYGNIQHLLK